MAGPSDSTHLVGREITVKGSFDGKEGRTATDLSGIASAARLGKSRRRCLVVDNKGLLAQFAHLDLDKLTLEPRRTTRILPKRRRDIEAIGSPPDEGKPGRQYTLDGEAVTWLRPHYYIAGSHSLRDLEPSPKADDPDETPGYRRSAHLIARLRKDGTPTELSYRLNKLLRERQPFSDGFLKLPEAEGGVNIEGLAAWRSRLYFGFRSPVTDFGALLLCVRAEALFIRGARLAPRTAQVQLGGLGIRSLCFLPDGRLLVLAGPNRDEDTTFSVNLCRRDGSGVQLLGTLANTSSKKAEGMLLAEFVAIPEGGGLARILILHDHPRNGHPRLYDLQIPPP